MNAWRNYLRGKRGWLLRTLFLSVAVIALAVVNGGKHLPAQTTEEMETPSPPSVFAPAVDDKTVRDCNALATHPANPERNGSTGSDDESLPSALAIQACGAAVEQNPQSGRLLFQLGRSYWVAGRFEDAIETFLKAGELGHGGALAYLGAATRYAVAGLEFNPEEAKQLYQRAAAAGFAPTAALAAEIVAGVEPVQEPEQEQAGGEPEYHYPETIQI